jgi:YD repeat-containing protein
VHSFTGFVYEEQDPVNANAKNYIWLRGNGERHVFKDANLTLPNTLFGNVITSGTGSAKRLTAFQDRTGLQYFFEPIPDPNTFVDASTGKKIFSRLIAIKDATGNQGVTISYDDPPGQKSVRVKKVASVSVPSRYLEFVYNADNTINVNRYDNSQFVNSWRYWLDDDFGTAQYAGSSRYRLTHVWHANSSSNITAYRYYVDGPSAQRGLIREIVEPNQESHRYEYYANGRVFRVTDGAGHQQSFNYNLFRNLTQFTDENGNVETYIHQDNGLLTKQIHDDRSRLTFTWGPQTGNGSVQWEEFLMQTSTDERGNRERFDYNSFSPNDSSSRPGRLRESISKDNITTTYEYAPGSYVSLVTKATVTAPSSPTALTQFTYDAYGHLTSLTDAEQHQTLYSYYDASAPAHLRGLRKSETSPKGVNNPAPWEQYEPFGSWETLTDKFTITGDTLAVQLLTPAVGQNAFAYPIRIDRVDAGGTVTRIVDFNSAPNNFRYGSGINNPVISGTAVEQVGAT